MKGFVKSFAPEDGQGYITSSQLSEDVYFHGGNVKGVILPQADVVVEFTLANDSDENRASEVRIVEKVTEPKHFKNRILGEQEFDRLREAVRKRDPSIFLLFLYQKIWSLRRVKRYT